MTLQNKILHNDTIYIVLLFFLSFPFLLHYTEPVLSTEDEIATFYSAKLWAEEKSQNIFSPLNQEFGTVFIPSFAAYKETDEAYLKVFSTQILFYGILIRIFDSNIFFYISPLMGTFSIICIYFIIKKILQSRTLAVIGAIFLFSMPVFLKWSISHFTNIPFITFILLSLLFFLHKHYILAGIFIGLSFIVRPTDTFLLLFPYILFMRINYTGKTLTERKKIILAFICPLLLSMCIFIISNYYFYKDPVFMPYLYTNVWPESIISNESFIERALRYFYETEGISSIIFHIQFFLKSSFATGPFLFLSLFGILLMFKQRKDFPLFFYLSILILILFYGKRFFNYYGFGEENLHNSFLRYMLPVYSLMPLGFSFFIKSLIKIQKNYLVIFLLIVFLLSFTSYTINFQSYGLEDYKKIKNQVMQDRYEILNVTESNAIILTNVASKHVYPDRNIAYINIIPDDLKKEYLIKLVENISEKNVPIYFVGNPTQEQDNTTLNILSYNFKIETLKTNSYMKIFKVLGKKQNV